jgi:hypothetical protein
VTRPCGTVILLGFVYLPSDPLAKRFADLAATQEISADTRAQIWRDTSGLIRAYPLFGCGLGGYALCFLKYKTVAPTARIICGDRGTRTIETARQVSGWRPADLHAVRSRTRRRAAWFPWAPQKARGPIPSRLAEATRAVPHTGRVPRPANVAADAPKQPGARGPSLLRAIPRLPSKDLPRPALSVRL